MKNIIAFTLLTASSLSSACPTDSNTTYTSPKAMTQDFEVNLNFNTMLSSVTESEYNEAFNKIRGIYTPIFAQSGFQLLLESNWNDSTEQAFSTDKKNNPNRRKVYVSGGFARRRSMTKDALLTTICHEIGHHLGGYPIMPDRSWPASAEGQADYFATSKCLKLVLRDEVSKNESIANSSNIPEFAKDDCSKQYPLKEDQNLCIRLALASEEMSRTYVAEELEGLINIGNIDRSKTSVMDFDHPRAQCRLATLYQGALCNVDPRTSFSRTEEVTGACNSNDSNELGNRPLCWFVPKN